MKQSLHFFAFLTLALLLVVTSCQRKTSNGSLAKVHIIATGGTIAGSSTDIGYDAGKVSIENILQAVPELTRYAELDYEQFCNIGSQDMSECIWLSLAKRVNQVLESEKYDAVLITHGTDTMEETAFFLNLTIHNPKPVILVGSMRPSDAKDADGPSNLLKAVQTIVKPDAVRKEVMCCLGGKIYEAGAAFKNDTHSLDPIDETSVDWYLPHNANTGFYIDNLEELPEVGIVYGYGSSSTVALEAFVNAGYKGIVFAGVGDGNLNQANLDLAARATDNGVMIVRSSRIPYGGVYTEGGEVDDEKLGFIASGRLNPQKSRILLMLALTVTRDIDAIRTFFRHGVSRNQN
ncbi:MAG: type II asparaginase [Alistipes sp.]|nr:type II asparaginase [Candidatus Alistipes equi]